MGSLDDIQKKAQEQFDRQSTHYGKSHILADTADLVEAFRGVELRLGMTALDVATGGGHTAVFLAERGLNVTATDLSAKMLEAAAQLAQARGVTLAVRQHVAESLPYPDASFDIVACRTAAHHFSSPAQFARESARVLKPGGHFILIDGSVYDDEPEAEDWIHQVEKLRDPSHNRLLGPRAWKKLCADAGLDVLRADLFPLKQPDLEWYFQAANSPEENRTAVRALVQNAPESVRRVYRLAQEDGKIVWFWARLTLVAVKGN